MADQFDPSVDKAPQRLYIQAGDLGLPLHEIKQELNTQLRFDSELKGQFATSNNVWMVLTEDTCHTYEYEPTPFVESHVGAVDSIGMGVVKKYFLVNLYENLEALGSASRATSGAVSSSSKP